MKKLYAKGYFAMFILVCCVGILILLYGFHAKNNYIQGAELLCISGIFLILLFLFYFLKIFPNTWIEYSENIIVISRVSSKTQNTKKQRRLDKLNIKEISKYGFSFELLHENIEYTHYKYGALGIDMEIVFLMNDNTKLPIDLIYYTKNQRKTLLYHIYKNTGILPSGSLQTYL